MKFLARNKTFLILVFVGIFIIIPSAIFAQQETFVPLSPIPGISGPISFNSFLNTAFKIGLAAVAVFAVVWITYGGLEYMTTDSITGKSTGRERIQNAIIGLLIALLIWVILYTINPNLLNFDIRVSKTAPPPGQNVSSQQNQRLENKGGAGLIPRGIDTVDPGSLGP